MLLRDGRLQLKATTILIAVAAVLASCSDGGGGGVSRGANSGRSPTPSPSLTTLPDFTSGGDCPFAPLDELPDVAGCLTMASGDADGDGELDTLMVYALLGEDGLPRAWRIRVETPSEVIDRRLDAGTRWSYPRAVGGADFTGDGRAEWFVKVLDLAGHGATWRMLNAFVLDDGFEVITYEGEPLPLYVGGISRTGEGVTCRNERLILLRGEAQNVKNTNWRVSERTLAIHGTEAKLIRRTEEWLRLSDYNDPDLNPVFQVNCGPIHYSA